MSWSATIYDGYCVSSRKFAPSYAFPALTVNNDVFQVCGRDTRRQYAATPESFGTAASHSRWWLRIKKYPVRGLFQQCPVVVVFFFCRVACAGYAECMGVGEEFKEYMDPLFQLARAAQNGLPKQTSCRECWHKCQVQVQVVVME